MIITSLRTALTSVLVTNITTVDQQTVYNFKIAVNILQVEINLHHKNPSIYQQSECLLIGFAINNRFYVFCSLLSERSILSVGVLFLLNEKVDFVRRVGKMVG